MSIEYMDFHLYSDDHIRCNRGIVCGGENVLCRRGTHGRSSRKSRRSVWCRMILRESWAPHTPQSFVYVLTRTSTDRVGENVTGCSLGKMASSDLRRMCGRLGDAAQHVGAQKAFEQRLLPIWYCNTVYMKTSLMCGDAIHQV